MKNPCYLREDWPHGALCGYTSAGWYFWDEVYYCYGPYETEEAAKIALDKYCEDLLK